MFYYEKEVLTNEEISISSKVLLGVATVVSTGFDVAAFFRGERLDKKSCDQIATSIREQEKAEKKLRKWLKRMLKNKSLNN